MRALLLPLLLALPAVLRAELPEAAETALAAAERELKEKNFGYAYASFREAWIALEDQWHPPPGLLFNMALAADKTERSQFEAANWYLAFAKAAPESPLAPEARSRADVLLKEADRILREKADLTADIFRQVKVTNDTLDGRRGRRRDKWLEETVAEERQDIENAVKRAAAVYIALGQTRKAMKLLKEFGLEYKEDDVVTGALVFAGEEKRALKYSRNKEEVEDFKKTFGSIRSDIESACTELGRNWYIFKANALFKLDRDDHWELASPYHIDRLLESDWRVMAATYEPYTRSFFTAALERSTSDDLRKHCD